MSSVSLSRGISRDVSELDTVEKAYIEWADQLVQFATGLVGPANAPDVVADAFASVLARGDFTWSGVRNPEAYMYRAVTNHAYMLTRQRKRRHAREVRVSEPATPVGVLLRDPAIARAVSRLSVQQRAVVFMTYWEDQTNAEVADRLGISPGSVKRHLTRARSKLKEVLQ